MNMTVEELLAAAPSMTADAGAVEPMRAQAYRALKAYARAEEKAQRAEDEARARRAKADELRETYLARRSELEFAARAAGVEALPASWCEEFEQHEEERRERSRARRRSESAEGAGHDGGAQYDETGDHWESHGEEGATWTRSTRC